MAVHIFGGGGLESRLNERLRQKEGDLWLQCLVERRALGQCRESVGLYATYAPDKRARVIEVLQEEIKRMTEAGITAAELARAKKDIAEGRRQSRADLGAGRCTAEPGRAGRDLGPVPAA